MTIRIGIVDNDPYALTVMKTLIERLDAGFEVIWTTDIGAVAISRCVSTAKRPDVLVTDMAMAGADGPEISRAIRARTSQGGGGLQRHAGAGRENGYSESQERHLRCGARQGVSNADQSM